MMIGQLVLMYREPYLTYHPSLKKHHRLDIQVHGDGYGELPDGGHRLNAEEQGRGEVIDPSDTLEQKTGCQRK